MCPDYSSPQCRWIHRAVWKSIEKRLLVCEWSLQCICGHRQHSALPLNTCSARFGLICDDSVEFRSFLRIAYYYFISSIISKLISASVLDSIHNWFMLCYFRLCQWKVICAVSVCCPGTRSLPIECVPSARLVLLWSVPVFLPLLRMQQQCDCWTNIAFYSYWSRTGT